MNKDMRKTKSLAIIKMIRGQIEEMIIVEKDKDLSQLKINIKRRKLGKIKRHKSLMMNLE